MRRRRGLIAGALILALGVAALLNELAIVPDVDWIWTLGLGVLLRCGLRPERATSLGMSVDLYA